MKQNPFENYTEVTETKTEFSKWVPNESPNHFIGTFEGFKEFTGTDDSKFIICSFVDCKNFPSPVSLPNYHVKGYAYLMTKLKGKEGRKLGIAYNGIKPHPKNKAKTYHDFSVYLMDEFKTDPNSPF